MRFGILFYFAKIYSFKPIPFKTSVVVYPASL